MVEKKVWTQLTAAYEPGTPETTHHFQIRDTVYVRWHKAQTLEPRWKGPYLVLLTTPTAVEGITAWIHAFHVKPEAHPLYADHLSWRVKNTSNPLKLKITQQTTKNEGFPDPDESPDSNKA